MLTVCNTRIGKSIEIVNLYININDKIGNVFIIFVHNIYFYYQSRCRCYLAQMNYTNHKNYAITTQCAWRARVARAELRRLKMVRNYN